MDVQTLVWENKQPLTLQKAAMEANANARDHGFWGQPRQMGSGGLSYDYYDHEDMLKTVPEKLLLVVEEVSECTQILRMPNTLLSAIWKNELTGKPEGFVYELADIIIRTLDLAHNFDLDIEKAVVEKMAFNRTRPFKHGKNF